MIEGVTISRYETRIYHINEKGTQHLVDSFYVSPTHPVNYPTPHCVYYELRESFVPTT